nr:MAG TPA: DNA polymerase III, alpha subunit [Caudoviricetes sp.]
MADNFIHTHLHSQFSNYGMKDAISSVDGIIQRVHELGQRGFALTDHNGCSGLIDTYVHLQKYNKKHGTDLKLLMGSELYYTYDVTIKDKSYSHILFLAKNQQGLENLFKLTTEAHKHYYYKSRCDLDMIRKYSQGLICTSACMGGWLKGDNRESLIPQFKDIFGEDLYFEIHTYQHEDQKRFNAMVAEMGAKYDVPLIAACDSHYVHEEDYALHKAFRGRSQDDDEDQYYGSNDFFIQSEAQVFDRLYPQFGIDMVETMVENTNVIFDKCNAHVDFNLDVYPKFVKDGDVKPVFLQALREGYKQKIIGKVTPEFKKRVDERVPHEIDILEQVGYMDYLLITKDILDACRKRDIPVGHGRGCSEKGTKVLMSNGMTKNIEDVRIGDIVVSHTGNPRIVENVFSYKIKEPLTTIKVSSNDPMNYTNDHKFLAIKQKECVMYNGNTKLRKYCSVNCKKKCCHKIKPEPQWIPVGKLEVGDYVFYPKCSIDTKYQLDKIDLRTYLDGYREENGLIFLGNQHFEAVKNKYNPYLLVTGNLARFIGYFIGNGWTHKKNNWNFGCAFNNKQDKYREDYISLVQSLFCHDVSQSWNKRNTCVQIHTYSTVFAKVLKKMLGENAATKHIPDFLVHGTLEQRIELLKGLFATDGFVPKIITAKDKINYSSINYELCSQVKFILSTLGIDSYILKRVHKKENWCNEYKTVVKPAYYDRFVELFGEWFDCSLSKKTANPNLDLDDYFVHQVHSIESVSEKDTTVYDIQVAVDHSYIGNQTIVHNSVGGCECAYLLDITSLDAITNNLYFERFANPNRVSPPDVDNDCSKVRRGEVIQYLEEKYKYVYQCRTFSYMKASGALKEAARCLNIDHTIADAYSKKIKDVSFDDDEDYHDNDLEYAKLDHVNDGKHPEMFELAKNLVGIMTGFGKHASAVIVSNQDITKYCSLEMQKDSKTKEETFVASTNFKHLESMGFLKEDILGLRTLDVINDCVTMAKVKETLDLAKLPWDDKPTLDLLCKGDTLGVFQMKSPGMIRTLKSIAPKNFVDLISVVALYRPACILTGMLDEYIERRNGKPFEYLDERLEEPLGETYGIMVFQEQIMRVCQIIAGYSMAEADTVRRAVGKKDHDLMQEITAEFVDRAVANGTDKDVAKQILDMIIAAASYGFNKAHSQSYGYMAYITAYLKTHYPLEFYVATINSEDGNQEKILPYIQEIKRKGIEILPPDLRHSQREWTVDGNAIRVGLAYIKGINKIEKPHEYTIDAIFSKYTKLQLEGLVGSGALDFLGETNELMALIPKYKSFDSDRKNAQNKIDEWNVKLRDHQQLMQTESPMATPKQLQSMEKKLANIQKKIQEWTSKYDSITILESPDLTSKVPLATLRYKYLGCSFENPLKEYNTELANGRDVKAIIVSDFKQRTTKTGKPMAYVFDHLGNKYVMWSSYLVELKTGVGYYIQLRGDCITKAKPLELKK